MFPCSVKLPGTLMKAGKLAWTVGERCALDRGHKGAHKNKWGTSWKKEKKIVARVRDGTRSVGVDEPE